MKRLSVRHLTVVMALVAGLIMLASIAAGDAPSLGNIELVESPTATTYTISPSAVVQYQEYAMSNPSRLVIDLVGVKNALKVDTFRADGRLVTAVRASQFQSEPDLVTRVVFELAEGTHYKVTRRGTEVEVSFTGTPDVMGAGMAGEAGAMPLPEPQANVDTAAAPVWVPVPMTDADDSAETTAPEVQARPEQPAPQAADTVAPAAQADASAPLAAAATASQAAKPEAPAAEPAPPVVQPTAQAAPIPPAPAPATPAWNEVGDDSEAAWPEPSDESVQNPAPGTAEDEVVVAQNTSKAAAQMSTPVYGATLSNQPMTIDVQGADIKTVLRSISEFSGVNIIAGPDVEGPVVIHLKNVPWKEALDSILKSQGYGWRDDYGIIRVAPMDQLQEDEVKMVMLDRRREENQALVSKVVKLDYLNAMEIKNAMDKVTTPRGKIEAEKGTNSVVINDIPDRPDDQRYGQAPEAGRDRRQDGRRRRHRDPRARDPVGSVEPAGRQPGR